MLAIPEVQLAVLVLAKAFEKAAIGAFIQGRCSQTGGEICLQRAIHVARVAAVAPLSRGLKCRRRL